LLIDSPGIREFLPWEAGQGVQASFEDVEAVAQDCRFRDCRHEREPGCAVRSAVEDGRLDSARVMNAQKLRAEQDEARGKGRRGR
jgi:ribosome biogenesis GTPase